MGQILTDLVGGWPRGVNTSARPDEIGPNASPRAWNNTFTFFGTAQDMAIPGKRQGFQLQNVTPVTTSPAIVSQFEYNKIDGNNNTRYHLLVGDNGALFKLQADTTPAVADATATTPFSATTGQNMPAIVEAANLCFFANGADLKKFDGTSVTSFGITRPASPPTIADSGVAGLHNGTYEARYTYLNSTTGVESSASDTSSTTLTVTSKKINWTWTVSPDAQVDKVRLYLRNTSTMASFFEADEVTVGHAQPYTTNIADADMTIAAPTTNQNDPPISSIKTLAWHHSRMFAADDDQLYYSQVGVPEQFDPNAFERVNPQDGQRIVAIASFREVLVILKRNSLYILSGDDPNSWSIDLVDPSIGCVAKLSVVVVEGAMYWWSDIGPVVWYGIGSPMPIAVQALGQTISPTNINTAELINVRAAADIVGYKILWALPEPSSTRNTFILPYNYRMQQWESDKWDPMDIASLAVVRDSNDDPWVYLGSYAGQVFKMWASPFDGMRDVNNAGTILTKTGTATTTAGQTTFSTVTPDGSVTLDTDGGGLIERICIIEDSTGGIVGRQRITANTTTTFTLANTVSGLSPATAYTWTIGSPDWQFDTAWFDGGAPFYKKRYTYLFLQLSGSTNATFHLEIYRDFDPAKVQRRTITSSFSGAGGVSSWDVALWDTAAFETPVPTDFRLRMGNTGRLWQARIRNRTPGDDAVLYKIGMEAEMLTSRS